MLLWATTFAIVVGCGVPCIGQVQPRPELVACAPACQEALPTGLILDCENLSVMWLQVPRRQLYGPLRCVGPVKIGVEARPFRPGGEREVPLRVQLRTTGVGNPPNCTWESGMDLWELRGVETCDRDSMWVWSPAINLHDILPIGATYWIQLEAVVDGDFESPFVRCFAVDALPTTVESTTWAVVKRLYGASSR